jgi:hypothetical protein
MSSVQGVRPAPPTPPLKAQSINSEARQAAQTVRSEVIQETSKRPPAPSTNPQVGTRFSTTA